MQCHTTLEFIFIITSLFSDGNCQPPQSFCDGTSKAEYLKFDYHKRLMDTLYKYKDEENIFNIKQSSFQLSSGSKLVCIPVTYNLLCTDRSHSCDILNGSSWSFLYTTFDTTDTLGDFFLHYAVGGLRVFGFEWENECNAYQPPVSITLQLQTIPNVTDSDTYTIVCQNLMQITTLLPAIANSREKIVSETEEVSSGYVKLWHEDHLSTQADKVVYPITTITIITAEIVMIGAYLYFHQTVKTYIDSKKQPYYYYFWAAQFLVVVLLLIALPSYLGSRQHNVAIAPYVYLMTMTIDFLAAFIVCLVVYVRDHRAQVLDLDHQTGLLPVPFESWICGKGSCSYEVCKDCPCKGCCCKKYRCCVIHYSARCINCCFLCCYNIVCNLACCCISCLKFCCCLFCCQNKKQDCKCNTDHRVPREYKTCCDNFQEERLKKNCTCSYFYRWILNLLGLTLTFFLVSYVLQALPNILIAYYSYPSKSLVRLSFLQIALTCLVVNVAGIIFLMEKLGWQCYVLKNEGEAPQDMHDFEQIIMESVKSNVEEYDSAENSENGKVDKKFVSVYKERVSYTVNRTSICITGLQIVALLFILATLTVILVLIGTIVFKQTTDDNDTVKGLLTTIPTILGNVLIYITRKKMFDVKNLQIKPTQDAKSNK